MKKLLSTLSLFSLMFFVSCGEYSKSIVNLDDNREDDDKMVRICDSKAHILYMDGKFYNMNTLGGGLLISEDVVSQLTSSNPQYSEDSVASVGFFAELPKNVVFYLLPMENGNIAISDPQEIEDLSTKFLITDTGEIVCEE